MPRLDDVRRAKVFAVAAACVMAILAGAAIASLTQTTPREPVALVVASPSLSPDVTARPSARPSAGTTNSPEPTATGTDDPGSNMDTEAVPENQDLPTNWPARVTKAGDGLRVRTRPGLGDRSKPLSPLLPAGTSVLVLDGPERADGFDWYQVMTYSRDERLTEWAPNNPYVFGWVAARQGDRSWLDYAILQCEREPTIDDVLSMPPAEFLACFGPEPVTVAGRVNDGLGPLDEGGTISGVVCPELAGLDRCDVRVPWLQVPLGTILLQGQDTEGVLPVALRGAAEDSFIAAQSDDRVEFTIAMDSRKSGDCRVVDTRTGKNYITRDEAVTRCRLTFVLRDVQR